MSYNQRLGVYASVLLLVAVMFSVIHHYMVCGEWFHWQALVHHEPFIVAVLALALGLFTGSILRGK